MASKKIEDTYSGQKWGLIGKNEWSKEPHHGVHPNVQNVCELKTLYFIVLSWVITTKTKEFEGRIYWISKMLQGLEKLGKVKVESRSKNND